MRKPLLLACTILAAAGAASAADAQTAFTGYSRYDLLHRVTGTIAPDPDGAGPLGYAAVRNTYDTAGHLVTVEKGQIAQGDTSWTNAAIAPANWTSFTVSERVDTTYDALDRKTVETLTAGGTVQTLTQYSYDITGRLECTAVRMNSAAFGALPASASRSGPKGPRAPTGSPATSTTMPGSC